MDPAKSFDAYEVIGVITPGAVVTLMMALHWPEFRDLLGLEGLSVGGLGIFVIAAFVTGHLVQALGNVIDIALWALPGMPTAWVRRPAQTLLSADQRIQLQEKVTAMEQGAAEIASLDRTAWRAITVRLYSRVQAAGRAGRIDGCNRTYGLSRGLTAAFLICGVWLTLDARGWTPEAGLAFGLALVALYRMIRSSIQYARALLVVAIDLS